jgi:peptidoglycan/xylan/chitin deacetylase (PgdA/CDA1 family)
MCSVVVLDPMPTELGVVERLSTERRRVALTFDDGPSQWTEQVLDALAEHAATATFFVRGSAVDARTEGIVQRAYRAGCDIGNHTQNHLSYAKCDDATARNEFAATHGLLEGIIGERPRLTRPPFGHAPDRLDEIAAAFDYRATIMWSISPDDWAEPQPTAEHIVGLVLRELHPGAIVLLHDGWDPERGELSRRQTLEAVRLLLPEFALRGYEAVTASRLLDDNEDGADTRPSH